jgi:hypothetical protein
MIDVKQEIQAALLSRPFDGQWREPEIAEYLAPVVQRLVNQEKAKVWRLAADWATEPMSGDFYARAQYLESLNV